MRYLLLCLLALSITGAFTNAQPNIVLIISDDHAYQAISAYGNSIVHTPSIDRIASEGALFQKAYVANSICGPSRASILTGKYSHANGFKDNRSTFDFNQNNFAKVLQQAGYQTAWIGKMHLGENTPQGFDYYSILPGQGQYYNPDFLQTGNVRKRYEGYVTNIIEDVAEDWMDKRNKQKPFCLVIGHKATHRTWMPDTEDLGRFDSINVPLPSTFYDDYATRKAAAVQDMTIEKTMRMAYDLKVQDEKEEAAFTKRMTQEQRSRWNAYYEKINKEFKEKKLTGKALTEWKFQRYMRDYLSTAASLDRNIGRTLDYLDKNNLTENTIVIYMSDQGFYMGEHGWFDKRFMYEPSFRTPMAARYPSVIKPGSVFNQSVMNIDIAPTLLELANAKVPEDVQGQSFFSVLKGKPSHQREAMYYHYYEKGEHSVSPHFGIKTARYKLIRFYDKVNAWELFDLEKDPDELHNIYNEKTSTPIIKNSKQTCTLLFKNIRIQKQKLYSTNKCKRLYIENLCRRQTLRSFVCEEHELSLCALCVKAF
ncbi:sulfatase family protein [Niabella ginsengisoli]|uniref:Sulfatase n=1 Tax=Niabella ginsengisoli TaxID=522298 RepID=A0ABS9SNX8_9BACT|nr:sulfatase [Niabella ginsengisoli]MCH5599854.1 sulfatase [Niabella ginsengisoli]